nr:hypothetical protein [Tanacetum cinerariifolium]
DKVEEENGARSSDDGVENESEKDDVDECNEKEDAIEKMNETEQVEFRRISLTWFRSCASRSQTEASQSRQST